MLLLGDFYVYLKSKYNILFFNCAIFGRGENEKYVYRKKNTAFKKSVVYDDYIFWMGQYHGNRISGL